MTEAATRGVLEASDLQLYQKRHSGEILKSTFFIEHIRATTSTTNIFTEKKKQKKNQWNWQSPSYTPTFRLLEFRNRSA